MPEHILQVTNKPQTIDFEAEVNQQVNFRVTPKHGYEVDHWEDLDPSDSQYRSNNRNYIVKSSNNALVVRFRTKDVGAINATNVVPSEGSTIIVPETMPFDATFTFDSTKNWAHKIIVNGLDGDDYSLVKHSKYEVVIRFNESARAKLAAASVVFEDLYSNRTSTYNMRPSIKNITISTSVEPAGAPDLNITPGPYTDKTSVTIDWGTKVGYKGLQLLVNNSPVQVPHTATFQNDVTIKGIYEQVLDLDTQGEYGVVYASPTFGHLYFGTKQLAALGDFKIMDGSNQLYPTTEGTRTGFFKVPISPQVNLSIVIGNKIYPFRIDTSSPRGDKKYGRIYLENGTYVINTNAGSDTNDESIKLHDMITIDAVTNLGFKTKKTYMPDYKALYSQFNAHSRMLNMDEVEFDLSHSMTTVTFSWGDHTASVGGLDVTSPEYLDNAILYIGQNMPAEVKVDIEGPSDSWGTTRFVKPSITHTDTMFTTNGGDRYYGTREDVYYDDVRIYVGDGLSYSDESKQKEDEYGKYVKHVFERDMKLSVYSSQPPQTSPVYIAWDTVLWQVKLSKYDDWEDFTPGSVEETTDKKTYNLNYLTHYYGAYFRARLVEDWYERYLDTNTRVPMWRKGNLYAIDSRIFPSKYIRLMDNNTGGDDAPNWESKMAIVNNGRDNVMYLDIPDSDTSTYYLEVEGTYFKLDRTNTTQAGYMKTSGSDKVIYLRVPESTKFTASDITIDFRYESYESERDERPTGMNGMTGDVRDDYEIIDYGVGGMRFYGLFHYNGAGIKMLTSQYFYGFNSISLVGKPYDEYLGGSHHHNDELLNYVVDERSGYRRGYYNNQLKDSHVLISSIDGIQGYTENFDIYYKYYLVVDSTLNQEPFGNSVFGPLHKLNEFNN